MTRSHQTAIGRCSPSVKEVMTEDGAVLLDIRQRLCVALSPVAAQVWGLLKKQMSFDEIVEQVISEFDVPREKVQGDLDELLRDLTGKGLLIIGETGKMTVRKKLACDALIWLRRFGRRLPGTIRLRGLTFKAFVALLLFDLTGLPDDFVVMRVFITQWTVKPIEPPSDCIARVCHAVNHACVWYPKRVLCLQRAAVTTCLLREVGVAAELVLGAQKMPFKAHAWTEVDNKPINERRDVQKFYLVWERG